MQGSNYGLLMKTIKKIPKIIFRPAGRVLTFDRHQICSAINRVTIYASTCDGKTRTVSEGLPLPERFEGNRSFRYELELACSPSPYFLCRDRQARVLN